jgi:hypothetical protein
MCFYIYGQMRCTEVQRITKNLLGILFMKLSSRITFASMHLWKAPIEAIPMLVLLSQMGENLKSYDLFFVYPYNVTPVTSNTSPCVVMAVNVM